MFEFAHKFIEFQRAVIQRRGQPEPILDEGFLAAAVAAVHASGLRQRHMALINEDDEILGEIIQQGVGHAAGGAPAQHAGVILDALAEADLLQHLDIVVGALGNALRLDEFIVGPEIFHPFITFPPDLLDPGHEPLPGDDVVGGRVDGHMAHHIFHFAGHGIDLADAVHLITEKLHPDGSLAGIGREDFHHIPAHTEFITDEIDIVALVLDLHQLADQLVPVFCHALPQRDDHVAVIDGVAQGVDAGDGGNDDDIPALRKGGGGGMAQLFYLLIDGAVLLNVGIGGGDVGFRLVVVVVAHKVFHRILREELLELAAQLRRQRFIVGKYQRGPVDALDDIGHGEGFAAAGHALQRLHPVAGFYAFYQGIYGLRLVAGGLERGYQFKSVFAHTPSLSLLFHSLLYHKGIANTSSLCKNQ